MTKKQVFKIIGKFALIIGIVACIAVGTYFILRACGFTTADDFARLRDSLGNAWLFWGVIVLLQAIQVVFIPISNQIISVPVALLFPNELWKVFLASWIGIEIGTICLYFIGRAGGGKLLKWILGDKDKADKCVEYIKKGKWFYSIGMCIPFIPDDILTTLAGTAKYNFWFVLVASFITRGICTAFSVFGIGILGQYWWGWIIIGAFLLIFLIVFILVGKRKRKLK